jgi:hypothetical protein
MEKLPLTNWFGWAEVVGTARFIVNSTAPGDCCYMSEDSIETMKQLAELTPMQQAFLAKAMQEAEKLQAEINTAEEARARA